MTYKQQETATLKLTAWLTSDSRIFVFSGYSGTGKSYTICEFIKWYKSQFPDRLIAAIAPTHKAVKNLKSLLCDVNGVNFATISSFLGLTAKVDQSTGKQVFIQKEASNLQAISPEDYDLVICDEYSMIPKEQVLLLNRECNKLIYVGDPAQLQPVGEQISHVTTLDTDCYQLTDIVRYSGDLARIANTWRVDCPAKIGSGVSVSLKNIAKPIPVDATPDESIIRIPKIEWIENYSERVKLFITGKDDHESKLIVFTNKCADKWNTWVRSEIWDNQEPFNVGDRLICKKPLFRVNDRNGKLEIVIANSTELIVRFRATKQQLIIAGNTYDYYPVPVTDEDGNNFDCYILSDESKKEHTRHLKQLCDSAKACTDKRAKSQLWEQFYILSQTFDDVSFSYAITTHKSQGSTYDSIYLDLDNLRTCPDLKRITYTALTRSKKAYIC